MLRLLTYLLSKGICTSKEISEFLSEESFGLPAVTSNQCASGCSDCIERCPTDAIVKVEDGTSVLLDRGRCIACQQCVSQCPTSTLINDRSTNVSTFERTDLVVSAATSHCSSPGYQAKVTNSIFGRSLAIRVVSTGCTACDLEMSAASNPIFDLDRFGISVVASPRFADALLITGPVPKSMQAALLSCYRAMAEPKLVIACGTCAISGGVHAHGYTEANGVSSVLPVDVFIPGCPPHPWQIIKGILSARKVVRGSREQVNHSCTPNRAEMKQHEITAGLQHAVKEPLP